MADCNSQGDILAQNDDYIEPVGADFASWSWLNEPMCDESWGFKSTIGGESEFSGPSSNPVVTYDGEEGIPSGSGAQSLTGAVESPVKTEILTVTYELSGGVTDSGDASFEGRRPNQKGENPTFYDYNAGSQDFDGTALTNLIVRATDAKNKTGVGTFPIQVFRDFLYDEFGPESINSLWDKTGTAGAGGSIQNSKNDRLDFILNGYSKTSTQIWLGQGDAFSEPASSLAGIDEVLGVDQAWDIWYRMALPDLAWLTKNASGRSLTLKVEQRFIGAGSATFWTSLVWNGTLIYIGVGTSGSTTTIDSGLTQNNVWVRHKWSPGDTEISNYYAVTDPTVDGWTGPNYASKANPQPTGHDRMDIELRASSTILGGHTCSFEFLRRWSG